MTPIAIVEEALSEGRALFSAAEELRDLFKDGRAEIDKLKAEAKETVDGVLSKLRSGLDAFKAEAAKVEQPEPLPDVAAEPEEPEPVHADDPEAEVTYLPGTAIPTSVG